MIEAIDAITAGICYRRKIVQRPFCKAAILGSNCRIRVTSGHFSEVCAMSALLPKVDMNHHGRDV